ncbi:hypothetical protein TVAG_095760 [Trichomonas vaginalis G3]|uniref:E3 ubiquitin protein ligase n=1 Tax=Trichomonas vaginalis (strain ATCC PRA-98 / G3) TaxID=412133 RepID=A2G6N2_TRIV3|nr:histone monoubiquitination [Trichomonas vaginalis G3]EAX87183.1 hypothetical protein TVAG_095760 [Trichomonas vaginalis G3]KAI5483295.1 histone monoubiquitination [Trichomonas vaginalis G3]|eukprot:XP_001300113.1 hypothetical protein [Trichomonas vaginalis G3]
MTSESKDDSFPEKIEKEHSKNDITEDVGLSAEILRLQQRIKHMEFNVDLNIKRGQELSENCFKLLRSTEMLACDFIFAEYLLSDNPDTNKVYVFLQNCIHPKFNLSSGKQEDFDMATKYVRDLQNLIQSCAVSLLRPETKQPQVPKRVSEFVTFLKDQKHQLQEEISANAEKAEEVLKTEDVKPENKEKVDIESPDFPSVLSKWLTNELHLGNTPDDETIELRCLINNVSRRLANVTRLHHSITEMKEMIIPFDQIDYTDCDAPALVNSPFFSGVKSSCSFLVNALKAMQAQKKILPVFQQNLEQCQEHLTTLCNKAQDAVKEMGKQLSHMNDTVARKEGEIQKMKEELKTFVDQVYAEPNLVSFSNNEKAVQWYNDFEDKLKKYINSDSSLESRLNSQLVLIQECRNERQQLAKLCDEQTELVKQIQQKNQRLFELIAQNKKLDEESVMQKDEQMLMSKYENALSAVFDGLHLEEMAKWADKLREVGEEFRKCAESQNQIAEDLNRYISAAEDKKVCDEKRKEIEQLSEMNYKMAQEVGNARLELESAKEDNFRAQQEVEKFRDWMPDCIDKKNSEAVKKYKQMAFCPLCKYNRRDSILTTCGHAVCHSCLERDGQHLCPICKKSFTKNDIKPFFLQ